MDTDYNGTVMDKAVAYVKGVLGIPQGDRIATDPTIPGANDLLAGATNGDAPIDPEDAALLRPDDAR